MVYARASTRSLFLWPCRNALSTAIWMHCCRQQLVFKVLILLTSCNSKWSSCGFGLPLSRPSISFQFSSNLSWIRPQYHHDHSKHRHRGNEKPQTVADYGACIVDFKLHILTALHHPRETFGLISTLASFSPLHSVGPLTLRSTPSSLPRNLHPHPNCCLRSHVSRSLSGSPPVFKPESGNELKTAVNQCSKGSSAPTVFVSPTTLPSATVPPARQIERVLLPSAVCCPYEPHV